MSKIETEQDVANLVSSIVEAARQSQETATFFAEDIRRLNEFVDILSNIETRVAIIGITSSGKSTLMNAVLGGQLLPTRVGPSSSKQVICGWDKELKGTVVFDSDSGKKPRLLTGGAASILCEIEKYGDEKFNPRNVEEVDEIRVHSPFFRFDKNLILIDTPGLDAYGLDQHKEVTMKLVLPTVDMVLFLTNVKCDSDQANLSFIDNVTTDEKPLVIVQNKIDSIEPKITKDGRTAKSVAEVKHDHFMRVRRMIANAKKRSVREAPIVQVSAKARTWEDSNLEELGKVLSEQIRLNSKVRIFRRTGRLMSLLAEMETVLRPRLASAEEARKAQQAAERQLAGQQAEVESFESYYRQIDTNIRQRLQEVDRICRELLEDIDTQYASSDIKKDVLGGVRSFLSSTSSWFDKHIGKSYEKVDELSMSVQTGKKKLETATQDFNTYFSAIITESQQRIQACCSELKMDPSQVLRSAPFRSYHFSIGNGQEKREVTRTRTVKQSGLGGFLKRSFCFGLGSAMGWGWKEETYTETVISYNVGTLVKEIKSAYSSFVGAMEQQLPVFTNNTTFALDVIKREMSARCESVRAQFKQELSTAEIKRMLAILGSRIDELRNTAQTMEIENARVETKKDMTGPLQECEFPSWTIAAARFAHQLSFFPTLALAQSAIWRAHCPRVLVCGWDENKLSDFYEWFFKGDSSVQVMDFSKSREALPPASSLVFLLFNAEQTGSFKGKLLGGGVPSDWLKEVAAHGKIVWVMDSIREHVSTGADGDVLMEALSEMLKVAADEFLKGRPFEVMACDRNAYWSALFHGLCFEEQIYSTETSRQRFIDNLSTRYMLDNQRRHMTGKYVSQFASLRKEIKNV